MSDGVPEKRKSYGPEIFLVSLAAILLEISYTRIFSYKLFYYFTYLTIGIALLGIGAGAVLVAVWPLLRRMDPGRLVWRCCLLAGGSVPLGYVLVAATQLNAVDIADDAVEAATLVWLCSLVFFPYLMVGIVVAVIFGARPDRIGRLYFADLVGAGLGCAAAIPLFSLLTPPGCVVASGLLFAAAGLRLAAAEGRRWLGLGAALCALNGLLVGLHGVLPDPVPDRLKLMSPQLRRENPHRFSGWGSVFRVDVLDGIDPARFLFVAHDGTLGSNLVAFDGEWGDLERFDVDVRSTPFSVVKPDPEVLVIGAAGGHEILASLYFGAGHVTAIELNPVTVSLLTDHFADYTGHIAEHPQVTLHVAEGRSFMKREARKYDLIWFVAPDSYAAMNAASSAAFVLSESYLYTRETILEALDHLQEGGMVVLQTGDIDFARKPNRAARYLSTAREAFASLDVEDFGAHVLVSSTPEFLTMVTVLLKREPFTPEEVERFRENVAVVKPVGRDGQVWHPRRDGEKITHPVQKVISLPAPALERWRRNYPYDVSAVTDDAPFFWHFASFRDALLDPGNTQDIVFDPEDAIGERVLAALLVFTVGFAALWLLLPLLAVRQTWSHIPHKRHAVVYFAALGFGFMFFEICLIQKLTLFLGYPTHSLTVTLFSILIFSGLGSLLSTRYKARRNRALLALLAALFALTLAYRWGLAPLVDGFVGQPLAVRVLLTVALLAPLGLCLGAFMPIGLASVAALSEHPREYVAWAWGVNGFCSVVSSVLATMLSMTYGFQAVLLVAAATYGVGVAAFLRIPEPE